MKLNFSSIVIGVLVSCLFLMQSCYAKSSGQFRPDDIEEKYRNEISAIEEFSQGGDKNGVFVIKIFDHMLAFPDRYVLLAQAVCRKEFNSIGWMIGFIEIGEISKDGFQIDKEDYEVISYSEHSMDVTIYNAKFVESGPEQIVISDGDMYLMIQDQNPKLWKAMLRSAKEVSMPKGVEFINQ